MDLLLPKGTSHRQIQYSTFAPLAGKSSYKHPVDAGCQALVPHVWDARSWCAFLLSCLCKHDVLMERPAVGGAGIDCQPAVPLVHCSAIHALELKCSGLRQPWPALWLAAQPAYSPAHEIYSTQAAVLVMNKSAGAYRIP